MVQGSPARVNPFFKLLMVGKTNPTGRKTVDRVAAPIGQEGQEESVSEVRELRAFEFPFVISVSGRDREAAAEGARQLAKEILCQHDSVSSVVAVTGDDHRVMDELGITAEGKTL